MIPWEGLNDMYREIAFHGGIPDTGFIAFGFKVFSQDGQNPNIEDLIKAQSAHPLSMIIGKHAKFLYQIYVFLY